MTGMLAASVATVIPISGVAAPAAAGPTEDGPVCAVLPTADGFAALREGPAVSAKLIARMKTEANVIVQERPKHHIVRQGGWIQVRYWPDGELPAPGEPGYDKAVTGWVAQRLIGECG